MPEINISVRDKVAAQTGRGVMVCDNSDYVLMFDFDEEWAAYTTKTARLRWNGAYADVVFDGDRCPCPAISDTALVRVGVYAGDLHTSTPAIVPCLPSIRGGDGAPTDPTPDVYDQLMEKLNSVGEVSEEEIAAAVDAYMADNPVAGAFTVHITYDEETDTCSADKTFEEIKAAYDAGQVVQAECGGGLLLALTEIAEEGALFAVTYSPDGVSTHWYILLMNADGTLSNMVVEAAQAVKSVNGKTGAVELTASDVGAMAANNPVANGNFSMGRKFGTTVGAYSHAEGYNTTASGTYSHAEGYNTTASGTYSHAEGASATASGDASHAEGASATAIGYASHAEGNCYAGGAYSHAEGFGTTASTKSQHVEGEYNIAEGGGSNSRGEYLHIAGNGKFGANSNAHTLDWSGNAWFAGDVYVGSTSGTNRDDGSKKLATEKKVEELIAAGGDSSLGITGALVGQTVKITEVDDEGKPTAWEAVEVHPDFELLGTLDVSTGDTQELVFDAPMREIYVKTSIVDTAGGAVSVSKDNGYRDLYFKVGETWKSICGPAKVYAPFGLSAHAWRAQHVVYCNCDPVAPLGIVSSGSLLPELVPARMFSIHAGGSEYSGGRVSGVRMVLTLNEGVENEATGTVCIYGKRA